MRRLCLLAALAAGSTVLHAQCNSSSPTPCISSLQSGFVEGSVAYGAAITAKTSVNGSPITDFWLYVNGVFNPEASNTVTWTSLAAPTGQQLQPIFFNQPNFVVADVPASLFASQGSATITVTESVDGVVTNKSNSLTFTVNAPLAALQLPVAVVGQFYSQPVASGGTAPYTISPSETPLPPGINGTYQADPNTNLNGTPTTPGVYQFYMLVTDEWGNTLSPFDTMTVLSPAFVTGLLPASCTASSSPTAGCTTGAFPLQINGMSFTSGLLVDWDGSTIGAGTVISSTLLTILVPANYLTAGTHLVSVAPVGSVASNSLPFVVYPAPVLTGLQPISVTAGSPSFSITVNGANFLAGMKVQWQGPSGSAVLIPSTLTATQLTVAVPASLVTVAGSASVTVLSADTVPVASNALSVAVNAVPLTITTPPLTAMPVGSSLNVTFAAKGGVPPYIFASSGTLPPNAQFTSGGTLTATLNTPGTYSFTVTVTDSARSTASQNYTLTVTGTALAIATTSPLASGQVGVAYPGVQFQASGGAGNYTWSAVLVTNTGSPAASAPPGMTFSAAGMLSGTPAAAGNYSIGVTVTDSAKATATGAFAITITTVAITTASLPNGTVGTPYSAPNMTATAGMGTLTWSATGLPAGISLSSSGVFSGTPTTAGAPTVRITVTDSQGNTASQSYTLTVNTAPLSITLAGAVPAVTVGSSFSLGFTAAGGVPPYSYSVSGLTGGSIASGAGGAGSVSGTPAAPGPSTVTVTVKDSTGATASTTFTVNATLPATPSLSFTGISTSLNPGSQSNLGVGFGAPYPVDVTVKLTLTFTGTDPAVQFSTGGTTATLTIPASQMAGLATVGVQTGTVAGTITITAQMLAGAQDITPTPAPSSTITVPATAPSIASITAARNSTGFTVTIVGYSSTVALSTANFQFNGTSLGTTTLSIPVSTIFAAWYQSSAAGQYGSNFTYTQPFTTSNPQAVTSVTVTLVNSVGTSAKTSANLQ